MLEIELKYPVTDFATVEHVLRQCQATRETTHTGVDSYFNAPDRDFAQTDEALRVRSIGPVNFVTYKGPKTDPLSKTRQEIEVRLSDGPEVAKNYQQLLQLLGYRFVASVHKQRTIYHLNKAGFQMEICLDAVVGLGRFVELEILAPENQLDAARHTLQETAGLLQLNGSERRSYLELLLKKSV
jgi:adenylate cyclase, class 2